MNQMCHLPPGTCLLCSCHTAISLKKSSLKYIRLALQGDDTGNTSQFPQGYSRPGVYLPTSYRLFLTDQHLNSLTGK